MTRSLGLAAVVIALAGSTPAQAQFVLGPALPPAYGARLGYGGGLGFSYHHRGLRVAGFAGGYYSRSVFAAPIIPNWSVLPPVSMLTPFGWSPGFLPGGLGSGAGLGRGFLAAGHRRAATDHSRGWKR